MLVATIACNLPRTFQSHLLKPGSFNFLFLIQGIFAYGGNIPCGQHEHIYNSDIREKHSVQMWPTCAEHYYHYLPRRHLLYRNTVI